MMVSYCQKVQKQFASRHTSHTTIPCLAIRLLRNIRAAAAPIRHLCNATLLASNRMSYTVNHTNEKLYKHEWMNVQKEIFFNLIWFYRSTKVWISIDFDYFSILNTYLILILMNFHFFGHFLKHCIIPQPLW